MPRLLGSISALSGILDRPAKPDDDGGGCGASSRHRRFVADSKCQTATARISKPSLRAQRSNLSRSKNKAGLLCRARNDGNPHLRAARSARGCNLPSALIKTRAQGRPGARCTRGLACKRIAKSAHEHTGSAEAVRPSLRNGFTAYNALSLVIRLSCHHRLRDLPQNLTPALRRQDHTTSPSASGAFVKGAIRVHRIPPHVVDDRERPS